ncbi:MAG: hypothetical protein K6B75_07360 [Lachnospiraceae bacterium]|nr:hypothetical protein [Lachnospiraceae bacterium]
MRKHYELMLRDAERRAKKSMRLQVMDKNNTMKYGGFVDSKGIVQPKFAIYRMVTMAAVYMNPDSNLYKNKELYERIIPAIDYIAREQRENGCFDLVDCNFFSGPDTAFCVKRLMPMYEYMLAHPDAPGADVFKEKIEKIIYAGAKGMVAGGFHTPNHRWAIASNLLKCYKLFGDAEFKAQAEKYLAEGIDCTSEGEFSERSAGNYNRINNDAMITIGDVLGDPAYYEYAKRNLTMMLTYLEPDDSIFTNNSTRQDRGVKVYPRDYYFEYLLMGHKLNNETFLAAANYIMDLAVRLNHLPDFLIYLMANPELIDVEYGESSIPTSYNRFYKESEIVRVRKDDYSYTILNHASNFVYFQHGDLTMSLKIGASLCEHRAFKGEEMINAGDTYELKQTMKGWYYLPFGEFQGTTDWWKMDRSKRELLHGPNLNFDVKIKDVEDGLDITVKADGVDRAPLRLELAFDAGCQISNESFTLEGNAGEYIVAKSGTVTASKGDYAIEVGPAFGNHTFVAGKFGSEGRAPQCFTVYFTDSTCFEHTIHVRSKMSMLY